MAPVEDIHKFREAVQASESLQEEIKTRAKEMTEVSDWTPVIELATQHGYTFTQDEIESVQDDIELTEEELGWVSGGWNETEADL